MPTSHLTQEKEKKFPNALIDVFRTAVERHTPPSFYGSIP
jgi:hypothetical protein